MSGRHTLNTDMDVILRLLRLPGVLVGFGEGVYGPQVWLMLIAPKSTNINIETGSYSEGFQRHIGRCPSVRSPHEQPWRVKKRGVRLASNLPKVLRFSIDIKSSVGGLLLISKCDFRNIRKTG